MNVNMCIVSLNLKINSTQQNDNVTISQQAYKIFLGFKSMYLYEA